MAELVVDTIAMAHHEARTFPSKGNAGAETTATKAATSKIPPKRPFRVNQPPKKQPQLQTSQMEQQSLAYRPSTTAPAGTQAQNVAAPCAADLPKFRPATTPALGTPIRSERAFLKKRVSRISTG